MKSFRSRRIGSPCAHEHTLVSVVSGMERTVCETCGHVSVKHLSESVTRGGIPSARHDVDSR